MYLTDRIEEEWEQDFNGDYFHQTEDFDLIFRPSESSFYKCNKGSYVNMTLREMNELLKEEEL
ncbi:hypothetical protein [Priestia megaterium]|uniref:hypothetical protein n=1 Tax=Priestia megaterium TaxID=1404 RepID=UPI000BFA87EF|nr:hypothetical protein [Priestia megaterium]PFJ03201.1 hypothetical protein COI84_02620 [Priestia megaterium]PGR11736.1 hypothetical protein COC62_14025 [Priestia megaterium]